MAPLEISDWCFAHDPNRGRERAIARKRGGRNRRTPAGGVAEPVPLATVVEVRRVLEQAVGDACALENSARRAHALATLLNLALRAVEVGDLEERLAALEAAAEHHRNGLRMA
jgi:hypothetical protein